MAYRNGTYVAFDGQGSSNHSESDIKYFNLIKAWAASEKVDLKFRDSHKKTYQVRDSSSIQTLKSRLLERMRSSKNMLIIISPETNYDRGMLNYEIEIAVDIYEIPLIVAYISDKSNLDISSIKKMWPKALKERIEAESVNCYHILFSKEEIFSSISKFGVNGEIPNGPLDNI